MKINYKVNFEISSSEVKDLILNLAEGFIKVQEWKSGHDKSKQSSISESIRRKDRINRCHEQYMAELDRRHKQRMAEIDREHERSMKDFHKKMEESRSIFNKKMEAFNKKMEESRSSFNKKKTTDVDISSLPEDVKRQIALDYIKKHPLSEDKQKQVADEYIRKYGVIK